MLLYLYLLADTVRQGKLRNGARHVLTKRMRRALLGPAWAIWILSWVPGVLVVIHAYPQGGSLLARVLLVIGEGFVAITVMALVVNLSAAGLRNLACARWHRRPPPALGVEQLRSLSPEALALLSDSPLENLVSLALLEENPLGELDERSRLLLELKSHGLLIRPRLERDDYALHPLLEPLLSEELARREAAAEVVVKPGLRSRPSAFSS